MVSMRVYHITNEQSFESVSYWMNTIKTSCLPEDVKVVMVGNKCDLENRRVVDKAKGESFAKEYDVPLLIIILRQPYLSNHSSYSYDFWINPLQILPTTIFSTG